MILKGLLCITSLLCFWDGALGHRRIINGSPVSITEVPFMALFRTMGSGEFPYMCGAAIVHERYLLSAAHCYSNNVVKYRVTVGTDKALQAGQDYEVERVVVHPYFNRLTLDYDVLVIKLYEKLVFNERVRPITMASPHVRITPGEILEAMGFGMTDPNNLVSYSNQLLKATLPYVDMSVCKNYYTLTDRMMCAGGKSKDSCKGDSGGPLTYNGILVGIVSFGEKPCGQTGVPAVYSRVSALRDFIDDVINSL